MILHPGHSMRKFTTEVWNAYIQCLALKQDFTCTSRVVGFVKQSQNQVWLFKVVENATPNLEHRDKTHISLHIYNISSQLYNAPVATQTCMTHSSPALFEKKSNTNMPNARTTQLQTLLSTIKRFNDASVDKA